MTERHDVEHGKEYIPTAIEQASSFEEFYAAIDFRILNEILGTIGRSYGADAARSHNEAVVVNASLAKEDGGGNLGEANHENSRITLDWERITAFRDAQFPKQPIGLIALRIFVHESVHITTRIPHALTRYNEAITDQISLEVLREYLRRTGDAKLLKREGVRETLLSFGYMSSIRMLNLVIETLAAKIGEDSDRVWRAIVSMNMRGTGGKGILRQIAAEMGDGTTAEAADYLVGRPIPLDNLEKYESLGREKDREAALKRLINTLQPDDVRRGLGL